MAQSENGASHDGAMGLPEGLTGEVRALIEMMGRGGIAELLLETGGVKLRLRARVATNAASAAANDAHIAAAVAAAAADEVESAGTVVTAPMIGTFYRAPGPGEPPFADVGDAIENGQTIGIIEAMKIMNEIAADAGGTIIEYLASSGQPVEYGQPLLRLAPAPQ
jgi:acetyl-CoA carboxylase biotin carboxyl carrier protein